MLRKEAVLDLLTWPSALRYPPHIEAQEPQIDGHTRKIETLEHSHAEQLHEVGGEPVALVSVDLDLLYPSLLSCKVW